MNSRQRNIGWVLALLSLVVSGAAAVAVPDAPPKPSWHPYVSWSGANSKIAKREYHLIRDHASWVQLWQRHALGSAQPEYDTYYDPLTLPRVDFDQCMVVAIFHGEMWNSAGVECLGVAAIGTPGQGGYIRFRFDDKSFQTFGPDGGGKRAKPYGFVVLPHSTDKLVLEQNTQGLIGKPAVWTEKKVFAAIQ